MPMTYNGCGTHYWGKKNLLKRLGRCSHCQREGELSSYDTRLCVVILFIPIIPLKRLRILDQCPSCRRHYVMESAKWEAAKQLEVSGAMDRFRTDPTPEHGIAAHQQLVNFHQLEQAASFRRTLVEKFDENANVHAYLGASLEHLGKADESHVHFTRAHHLRPDLPEARIGVAQGFIRQGKLDEARKLLDFLEKPGASQLYPMEPLNLLAKAYQATQRHADALALFAVLQKELPHLAELGWFRKLVVCSEKATRTTASQLPKLKFSFKRIFAFGGPSTARTFVLLGVVLALVLIGLVFSNEYIRRHRTLHIVNGYPGRATVQLDSIGEVEVRSQVQEVRLAEGRYRARISGPTQQEIEFTIRADYLDRWFDHPVWILNLGGEALLMQTSVTYGQKPPPPRISFLFGETFLQLHHVTHPFEELPRSLRLRATETRTLVKLEPLKGNATDVVHYYEGNKDLPRALSFAESWLQRHSHDNSMLQAYLSAIVQSGETNRAVEFLRGGVANRPVRVEWHRMYQSVRLWTDPAAALTAEYQEMLDAEPTNSVLLYLRGRLELDRSSAAGFFARSIAADAANPYPVFALGYEAMSAGDWARAKPLLGKATALRPDERNYDATLTTVRLASGEASAVEKQSRERLAQRPADFLETLHLVDALAVQGRKDDVIQVVQDFTQANLQRFGAESRGAGDVLRCRALYSIGDFNAWGQALDSALPGVVGLFQIQRSIELGKLSEAADALKAYDGSGGESLLEALSLGVAYGRSGNSEQAERWLRHAARQVNRSNQEITWAFQLLERSQPPSSEDLAKLVLPLQLKPIVLVALALRHPGLDNSLLPLAARLNQDRAFPYHLVARITGPGDGR